MHGFDPDAYGPRIAAILAIPAPDGLSHGPAAAAAQVALDGLTTETLFEVPAKDSGMANACLAGLWLRFDFGARGHAVAQALKGPTGDYWHAIHHRREPDYPNAKYWFRRVGAHPIHGDLLAAAKAAGNGSGAARTVAGWPAWDAFGFVDLCARHAGSGSADEAFCKAVQAREWELLFDYGYAVASGRD